MYRKTARCGPVGGDDLVKIASLIQQAHTEDGDAQVARALELVAGHVAQAPRVDRQGLAQHELHGEVGHARQTRIFVRFLEPPRGVCRLPRAAHKMVEPREKLGVGQHLPEPLPREGLKDDPRITRARPELGCQLVPQLVTGMIPGPTQIQCQLTQQRQTGPLIDIPGVIHSIELKTYHVSVLSG